jgi:hypothetical protein
MIFRPANDDDIAWVRKHLRPQSIRDVADMGMDLDEAWQDCITCQETERLAVIDDRGKCVALLLTYPPPEGFPAHVGYAGLFTTPAIEEQPIGFVRLLHRWIKWWFENHDYDEMCSWVSDNHQASYKMMTKSLGFKARTTYQPDDPTLPPSHLLCRRKEA